MVKHAHVRPFALQSPTSDASNMFDRWMLSRLQLAVRAGRLRFVLWDGYESRTAGPTVARIQIKSRAALLGLLWRADLYFGEAYMFDALEIDGDLVSTLEEIYRSFPPAWQETKVRWWPESTG